MVEILINARMNRGMLLLLRKLGVVSVLSQLDLCPDLEDAHYSCGPTYLLLLVQERVSIQTCMLYLLVDLFMALLVAYFLCFVPDIFLRLLQQKSKDPLVVWYNQLSVLEYSSHFSQEHYSIKIIKMKRTRALKFYLGFQSYLAFFSCFYFHVASRMTPLKP